MQLLPEYFLINQVINFITMETNPKKTPGQEMIVGKILQEMFHEARKLLPLVMIACLRLFPWATKSSRIIFILLTEQLPQQNKNNNYAEITKSVSAHTPH